MTTESTDVPAPAQQDVKTSTSKPVATTFSGKNLVVCIDGTSNQFGRSNTNVVKLFNTINLEATETKQLAYYSSGIGTRTKSQAFIDRMKEAVSDTFDTVFAWNVDKNIKDAYGWLVDKYEDGDRIFLFGFSRGAYQVWALAGMIHEVGLIRTRTDGQIAKAYGYYQAIRPGKPEERHFARKFKNSFCWNNLKVHFIGVWDTVSSVGLSRGDVSLPMSSPADYIRHALALDERRVKFMPEYFRKASFDHALDQHVVVPGDGVKEVWFPGSHSDVGGKDGPGKIYQAGNISLLWMCREASEHGLVLGSTDATWGPDDIDFGISNSMSTFWRIMEYIAIKQQVSYRGPGKDALRMHRSEPRLIMSHQKVHASILYANMYRPIATRGRGFDMSTMHETPEDTRLDERFWETDLFGNMEAQELVNSLGQRLFATECLDRLLFMLRFNEGKCRVRNVARWQEKFQGVIKDSNSAPHIRLVAIVAYYEASCDSPDPSWLHEIRAFDDARQCLISILKDGRHQYHFRAVTLLNALTKHKDLRDRILNEDVLKAFVGLVDSAIANTTKGRRRGDNFVQVMKDLNSLLQFESTRKSIIASLADKYPNSRVSRLSQLLAVNHPPFLIAALRMVLTLAQILHAQTGPNVTSANKVLSFVELRICELAKKCGGTIGPLAVEIWFTLHDPSIEPHPSLPDERFPENIASILVHTNFNIHNLVDEQGSGTDPSPWLTYILGLNAVQLEEKQEKLIGKLTKVAQKGDPGVRATMTRALLKLCSTPVIRTYLCKIGLVDIFVDQLQRKDSALLAAHALVTCLEYDDMRTVINGNERLPKYIVGMLQLDYFDDAIGQVDGLTIFVQLMQYSALREGVMKYDIKILGGKAGTDQLRNILSVLLYQDRNSTNSSDPYSRLLVEKSLELLKADWKTQKTGVTILTALAQTRDGETIIEPCIPKIIKMIIPENSEGSSQYAEPRPASKVMGPACTLRNLALIKSLQQSIRSKKEYHTLRDRYLSKTLVAGRETVPWHVNTPTKSDVTIMLKKMIEAVEGELSEEELIWRDTLPPGIRHSERIQHWDRPLMFVGCTAAGTALFPVALGACVGCTALTLVALGIGIPIYYMSLKASNMVQRNRKKQQGVGTTNDTHAFVRDLDWE